jgi:hypothetical protein
MAAPACARSERPCLCRLTPSRWRSVSTMAPTMATSSTSRRSGRNRHSRCRARGRSPRCWKSLPAAASACRCWQRHIGVQHRGPEHHQSARHQDHDADQRADRQILQEAARSRGEINVEHHDDEQEEHRHRADIDDHRISARNSAPVSRKSAAALKKARIRKSTECTGLRAAITMKALAMVMAGKQIEEEAGQNHQSRLLCPDLSALSSHSRQQDGRIIARGHCLPRPVCPDLLAC